MTTAAPALSPTSHDAVAHLPEGGTLTFQRVLWEKYEALLNELGARYRARVSYDHGRLEINMPLPVHDRYKEFISRLMHVLTEELEMDMEGLGSTTFKYELWQIAIKYQLNRLPLPKPPGVYIPEQRALNRIQSLPLDEAGTVYLQQLPPHHSDPFDRMLICQARTHNLILASVDSAIRKYNVKLLG